MTKTYGIGDLARESGVKVVTIRYYEQVGLLPCPSRTAGNYRTYGSATRQRLGFIRRCRDLGFTLDQIRDLLRLSSDQMLPCAEVKRIAAEHRRTVEEKLKDLQLLLGELRRITTSCRGKCVIADCEIIHALSSPARRKG